MWPQDAGYPPGFNPLTELFDGDAEDEPEEDERYHPMVGDHPDSEFYD